MTTETKPAFSFEFFPPKTEKAAASLMETAQALAAHGPEFMTVTFGAGGSTREGTADNAVKIAEKTGIPTGTHLTHICMTKDEICAYAANLWARGIRHIVALRGDVPKDWKAPDPESGNYYKWTSDFVADLKAMHPFEISVGAYPEKHPDAPSLEADIEALKSKCAAGADRVITQFFFENDLYYRFLEKTAAAGITTPIVPGLLPVYDFNNMLRFARTCQANVPQNLHEKFSGLGDKQEDSLKVAEDLLTGQIQDLLANGVRKFHFYSLNRADLLSRVLDNLGD